MVATTLRQRLTPSRAAACGEQHMVTPAGAALRIPVLGSFPVRDGNREAPHVGRGRDDAASAERERARVATIDRQLTARHLAAR